MAAAASQPEPYVSPEEYLAREHAAEFKSEYLDGEVYAMAGGSPEHNAITINLTGEARAQLKGTPCQAFSSDMKVGTGPANLYAYPDLTVVCGEPRCHNAEHRDVLLNPRVVFEVLSPSTEAFDRGRKWLRYQTIESLTDYVLVAQDEPRIEHFARQAEGRWLVTTVRGLEERLALPSVGVTLALSEVYDRVALPPPQEEATGKQA